MCQPSTQMVGMLTMFFQANANQVTDKKGLTYHIEHFNNTLRQGVGCMVRKNLSFSKIVSNHVVAIWNFTHIYNKELCPS